MGGETFIHKMWIKRPVFFFTPPLRQIQYSGKTNTISSINLHKIETFLNLICAVYLDTSRQFVAFVFDKPFW